MVDGFLERFKRVVAQGLSGVLKFVSLRSRSDVSTDVKRVIIGGLFLTFFF